MAKQLSRHITSLVHTWFAREPERANPISAEFARLRQDIRSGDVLLVEGRSRYSRFIQLLTRSRWTHCALYIGRPSEIFGFQLSGSGSECDPASNPPLLIEANLGEGVVVRPLDKYARHNIRICRPKGLSTLARKRAIANAMAYLDGKYDLMLIVRLAAFLLRQWAIPFRRESCRANFSRSSEREICTGLVWRSFGPVRFEVFPIADRADRDDDQLNKGTLLLTPNIFLQSPNFQVVKVPDFMPRRGCAPRNFDWT